MIKIKQPTLSIITVTLNAEEYLSDAIESVLDQTYPHIEHIVIDGQSTDKTVAIIKHYEKHLAHWISEPDRGIADAMNKGWQLATGEFILYLYADDYLVNENCLAQAVDYLDDLHDIFGFTTIFQKKSTQVFTKPKNISWLVNFKINLWQPSTLLRRSIRDKLGEFDVQFKIAMDHDFFLRAHRQKIAVKYLELPLTVMRDTGISSRQDWDSLHGRFLEEKRVHRKNCDSRLKKYVYHVYWLLYFPYRKLRYWLS